MKLQTRQYKLLLIGKGREYEDRHDKKKKNNSIEHFNTLIVF